MLGPLRRVRPLKRHIFFLCLFSVFMVWFHHTTTIQIIGNVSQGDKFSARLGIVYEWMMQPQDRRLPNEKSQEKSMAPKPFAFSSTDQQSDKDSDNKEYSLSHPFENTCQYPVLNPEDENLHHVIRHTRLHVCKRVQEELLIFDYDRGELIFNKSLTERLYEGRNPRCQYRPFSGGIQPRITDLAVLGPWIPVKKEITKIDHDLIEVKCVALEDPRIVFKKGMQRPTLESEIFRFAFGHIVKREETGGKEPRKYAKNDEHTLNIDFLVLDSTSLNMMKRHAPKSWKYMKEVMGFYHLEGYTKVGDNSMVNLMPILAGLRYGTQADDMQTEVPTDEIIDAESWPWLWKLFRGKGCATMFNDDIADYTRGFLNYPWTHVKGFAEYPTDHFMRPWHIYHRRYPLQDSSRFCFGNYPYPKLQLNFFEQMIKKYKDTCHFSFNFITDLPHDDPCNLELMDNDLQALLERLYTGGYLNNTVLFVMGDHGNRIGYVMYTYVGRIEERMTFFSVYFPEWYRKKYPDAMRQLEINKNRLTSNYDVYRMIREIFNDTVSLKTDPPVDPNLAISKGVSLFRPIPRDRACDETNVPPQHCVCLEQVPSWSASTNLSANHPLYEWSRNVVLNWTRLQLETASAEAQNKCRSIDDIVILKIEALTTNQMIQHGVRDQSDEQMKKLERRIDGDIEYVDVIYKMKPIDLTARTRLQYYKKPGRTKLFINVPPRPFPFDSSERSAVDRNCLNVQTPYSWLCQCEQR